MNMSDYGMLHLIHKLRAAEIERKQRAMIYGFAESAESAEPRERLGERLRRWLRGWGSPSHLARYVPVHLNN